MSVATDETGLHARSCECERCEAGYRPTERERELAARAHREALAARAKLLAPKGTPKPEGVRLSHTVRPMTRVPPPMTEVELAEMAKDREAFKARGRR